MKKLFISLFLLLPIHSFAQILQERIIQLVSNDVQDDFEQAIQQITPSFQRLSPVCPDLNIYLYNWYELDSLSTIKAIDQSPFVVVSQSNKKAKYRYPNDPLFTQQWSLFNKGDLNGGFDADIDILEVWQTTTGGLTNSGDTIVVAVLDSGINLDHPDLQGNIWTNKHEIPNNGLDDDDNGYIDDYYGWNFKRQNNDITNGGLGGFHGTPVAGIIGAKGNNSIGIAGINWQVKLMNLVINIREEAAILAAYDYVLQMRKRYNETDGKEGAFIVVTNASWGIDFGKAADSPIWCEMYNLLGEQGILSVGATSNDYINVDVDGDLPTSCDSKYLITVTNTTRHDAFAFSGYGKKHIDLSAPGSRTLTLSNEGGYSQFNGTSAAAPHVAGAIALLYAAPIEALGTAIKSGPQSVAMKIKASILNGVDRLESLQNITLTGGRLNLHNSLKKLYQIYYTPENTQFYPFIASIYPNPTTGSFNIRFNIDEQDALIKNGDTFQIHIYNSQWKLMYNKSYTPIDDGIHEQPIDVDWPAGIYYVRIRLGDYLQGEKFVVIK